jgi:hypothetical protein
MRRIAATVSVMTLLVAGCDISSSRTPQPSAAQSPQAPGASPLSVPAVGARGFPTTLYPRSRMGRPGAVARCPAAAQVQPAEQLHADAAVALVRRLHTRSLSADLHHADRAYWPSLLAGWRHNAKPSPPYRGRILLAGPLALLHGLGVPSELTGWVRTSCGRAVADASFVVVTGPRRSPALQVASVIVNRGGRPLLYFAYP